MKIPYIKYIEAQLVAKVDPQDVLDSIKHLPVSLNIEAIEHIYWELSQQQPDYFDPQNKQPADPDWIEEKELDKMYSYLSGFELPAGTQGIEKAIQLADDPLMYRLITCLALARIDDEDIELIVNGKYNMEYSVEDIQEFLHYFFDVSTWTLKHRQQYVKAVKSPELKPFYKTALKGDKEYLMWKLGARPDIEFDEMLADMTRDAYYNFKEKSKSNASEAQSWGTLAVRLADKLDKLQGRMGKKEDMLEEVEFKIRRFRSDSKSENEEAPHINDLE